jgi:hypothetical protein
MTMMETTLETLMAMRKTDWLRLFFTAAASVWGAAPGEETHQEEK